MPDSEVREVVLVMSQSSESILKHTDGCGGNTCNSGPRGS